MTPAQLDQIFPYVCFAYGATMTIALNIPVLDRIADERLAPSLASQWRSHRGFALVSMCVGAAWILQNLWLK